MWKQLDRRVFSALFGCAVAATSVSIATPALPCRADDAEAPVVPADSAAARKAAAAQKALAQQKISAILRARRAQALRTAVAYDDVFGQGAASLASVTSANFNAGTNSGSGSSTGSSYGYSAGAGYSSLLGGTTGTGTNSTTSGTTGTGTGTSTSLTTSSTVGSKIVEFAMSQLGQKVGNGSSRALIDAALSYAGAKSASQLQTQTQSQTQNQTPSQTQSQSQNQSQGLGRGHCRGAGQMTYGDVIDLSSAQPGDVVQFEDAVFLGMNYWMIMGTPEQLAIVYMIKGNEVILLDQDVNGVKLVQFTTINLADLYSGTITAYHPVANETSSDSSQTDGTPGTTVGQTSTTSTSTGTQSGTSSTGSTSKTVGTSNATTTQTQSSSGS